MFKTKTISTKIPSIKNGSVVTVAGEPKTYVVFASRTDAGTAELDVVMKQLTKYVVTKPEDATTYNDKVVDQLNTSGYLGPLTVDAVDDTKKQAYRDVGT
jgi:NMD protein affecting ribosome stability and mRNA decay